MFTLLAEQDRFVPVEEKKNYNGVDLMKLVCAIMVFIIHLQPFRGEVTGFAKYINFGLQQYLCRLAVPFYFVSSGFFLFKKMPLYKTDKEIIKAYCYKILRLMGIWYVLLFWGGTGHLWYLGATVIAIILVSLCFYARIKLGYIYTIAGVLYVIGLLGDSYHGMIASWENITIIRWIFKGYAIAFHTTRNGVFMGFIFVLMGATLSNCKIRMKAKTAIMGLVISMLFLFAEVFLLKYNDIPIEYNMYVFLLPATFFFFCFAICVELKDRPIYKHLRNISVIIYFSHLFVDMFVTMAIGFLGKSFSVVLDTYQFVITLVLTSLIAIFVDWLSCKERFKWVNWLIS